MSWNYADLSHAAKECGGPEALMRIIEDRGFQEGIKRGRIQTVLILAGPVAVTFVIKNWEKIVSFFEAKRKKITRKECEAAKDTLIQGIKEYDENHPEEKPADEPSGSQNITMD